jgi:hypothetical protein
MPLYLVIGYTSKKIDAGSAKVLYSGPDGGESKAILATANKDYPVRERYVRPYPNGGRKIDAAPAPAEPTPTPDPTDPTDPTDPADQSNPPEDPTPEDAPKAKKK